MAAPSSDAPLPANPDAAVEPFPGDLVRRYRARIYLLNDSGPEVQWDAQGTGILSVEDVGGVVRLVMASEEGGGCLMNVAVSPTITYCLRQSTVITWCDAGIEVGLSFEEPAGCYGVWAELCRAQGRPVTFEPESGDGVGAGEEGVGAPGDAVDAMPLQSPTSSESGLSTGSVPSSLPTPTRTNIAAICAYLIAHTATAAADVLRDNCEFLTDLFNVFEDLEELGDVAGCYDIYTVMKQVLLLNDPRIVHALMADRFYTHFLGVLEYETAFPGRGAAR